MDRTDGIGGKRKTTQPILSDINNDRAVDLVVTGRGSAGGVGPTIYLNQREGAFKAMPLYDDVSLPATRGVAAFDFDKDGWMDVARDARGCAGVDVFGGMWRGRDSSERRYRCQQV